MRLNIVPDVGTIVPDMGTNRQPDSSVGAAPLDPASVLFGSTRRRLLAWLFGHPDEAFYLRQLARQIGAGQGAVQRELGLLAGAGLVRRTAQGRQVYFEINRDSPIFPELQAIFLKTAGLADVLRAALAKVDGGIQVAFVFGSAARSALRPDSDIDVLVVGDVTFSAVATALAAAQERLGRDVNPTLYSPAEFREKVRAGHHFLTSVLDEPRVFLIGGPNELGELGAEWLDDRPPEQPT